MAASKHGCVHWWEPCAGVCATQGGAEHSEGVATATQAVVAAARTEYNARRRETSIRTGSGLRRGHSNQQPARQRASRPPLLGSIFTEGTSV